MINFGGRGRGGLCSLPGLGTFQTFAIPASNLVTGLIKTLQQPPSPICNSSFRAPPLKVLNSIDKRVYRGVASRYVTSRSIPTNRSILFSFSFFELIRRRKWKQRERKWVDTCLDTSAVASVNIIRDTYRRNSVVNNKCRYHSDRIDVLGSIAFLGICIELSIEFIRICMYVINTNKIGIV